MEVESPSVVEETVEKKNISPVVNTSDLRSFPPLPTQETTSAGNASGKSSYANVTGKPSGTKVNFHTLFTPGGERFVGLATLVPHCDMLYSMLALGGLTMGWLQRLLWLTGLNAMFENGPWFIRNNPLILKKWHLDVNLLKEDVGTVPVWIKLHGVPERAILALKEELMLFRISVNEAVIEDSVQIISHLRVGPPDVPSMSRDPLTGNWYPAKNKLAAMLHWLNHIESDAEYIADIIMRELITPLEFKAARGIPVSTPYDNGSTKCGLRKLQSSFLKECRKWKVEVIRPLLAWFSELLLRQRLDYLQ
ncbi:retrovirus-related pol polyprotein from transposon TNT 1-94 [Tanacetum coccineum]